VVALLYSLDGKLMVITSIDSLGTIFQTRKGELHCAIYMFAVMPGDKKLKWLSWERGKNVHRGLKQSDIETV
jgi:hypothetical protein